MFIEMPEEKSSLEREKPKSTKRHPSFWRNAREYFSEYTSATSLHGLQYLGEKKRSKFEKILWLIIMNMSLGACFFLILKTYRKWENTPVIITFAHNPMPVWNIPFPAITICPDSKWNHNVYNYTKYYNLMKHNRQNLTDRDFKLFADAFLLCEPVAPPFPAYLTTNEDLFRFMSEAASLQNNVILGSPAATFGNTPFATFSTVITEEGPCYSFNALNRDDIHTSEVYRPKNFQSHQNNVMDWSMENGYSKSAGPKTYPRRTISAGIEGGLKLLLLAYNRDLDYLCNVPVQGFKVHLHNPGDIPRMSMQYFRVPFDEDVTVAVKPDVITTSNSLRNYDPHKRGCYFANEKQLKYYKNYTQQNCLMECFANYALQECGCVSFYMPRRNTTPICGLGSTECIQGAKIKMLVRNSIKEVKESIADIDCDCLPSSTTLMYNVETSQTNLDWKIIAQGSPSGAKLAASGARISRVTIFFKEMQFMTSERNELYGITDFLANCGGLLGLFLGFSVISLIETSWFLTGRLCINWRKYGRHYWSASDDLLQNETYGHRRQSV